MVREPHKLDVKRHRVETDMATDVQAVYLKDARFSRSSAGLGPMLFELLRVHRTTATSGTGTSGQDDWQPPC